MNNKKYILCKKVLESYVNIITQNNIFNLDLISIASDEEITLINAIIVVFKDIKRFNCYFHYKKTIIDKLRKSGLLKNKNNEKRFKEIKEVINILGRIPIDYEGKMDYFNNIVDNIKKNYPYLNDFIDKYFSKYKSFEIGEYNYNDIPIDCRNNSYLENYNLYLKRKLGRKYKLNWDLFINFIKDEFRRLRDKLTENTEKNIINISKKTKFSCEKYNEKLFDIKYKIKKII